MIGTDIRGAGGLGRTSSSVTSICWPDIISAARSAPLAFPPKTPFCSSISTSSVRLGGSPSGLLMVSIGSFRVRPKGYEDWQGEVIGCVVGRRNFTVRGDRVFYIVPCQALSDMGYSLGFFSPVRSAEMIWGSLCQERGPGTPGGLVKILIFVHRDIPCVISLFAPLSLSRRHPLSSSKPKLVGSTGRWGIKSVGCRCARGISRWGYR